MNFLLISLLMIISSFANAQSPNLPEIILDAYNNKIVNCQVKLWVDNKYNQLYVFDEFKGNFTSAQHKKLVNRIKANIWAGKCYYLESEMRLPKIIKDASNNEIVNCQVKLWVDNKYNQLYVFDEFKGNFTSAEHKKLVKRIKAKINVGKCYYRGRQAKIPQIILDASNNEIVNCQVKLWVDNKYNQLYVFGEFKGNFTSAEHKKLVKKIKAKINAGKCYYSSE